MKKKEQKDEEDCDDTEDDTEVKNAEVRISRDSVRKPTMKEQKTKFIEDFNLLDIPKKINLKPLFDEFIIPMIPEGFEIVFKTKKLFEESGRDCFVENKHYTINEIVHQTEQPKSLVFTYRTRKILKIVKLEPADAVDNTKIVEEEQHENENENDESSETRENRIKSADNVKEVYMLSNFIKDLEELIDAQKPLFEEKIRAITSKLSKTNEKTGNERNVTRKNSTDISLTKKNSKSQIDANEADSDADSDTDNEEIDKENAHRSMIDSKFKSANLKRCFGRWSTRDIHDSKFNEEKLTVQFRTGRLGYFALATNRFSNFPYQSWDFKPEFKSP